MSTYYYDAYLEAQVDSASPLQLIHLAYESAITSVGEAREHLENGRIHERSRAITRATHVLIELKLALDHKAGGEISVRLARLYDYMLDRLREANFQQLAQPLIEVEELLRTIDDAWRKLAAAETEFEGVPATSIAPEPNPWMQPVEALSCNRMAYTL